MPELLEVESFRQRAAELTGRAIATVVAPDPWYLKRGLDASTLERSLVGRSITAARRIGKLLLLDTSRHGPTVGLRFGMTGRLLVDGRAAVDHLEYGSNRLEFERVRFGFRDGRSLSIDDPRRLGGVELDPDETGLGPDALSLTIAELRDSLGGARGPIKARLLDQTRVAGLGNLLVDEALWRAGLDPARDASSLSETEVVALHRSIRTALRTLGRRGGSHTGDLQPSRSRDGSCPRCAALLQRRPVGGRTTFSCPACQR